MSTLRSKIRRQGNSTVTTIPAEVVRRLDLPEGQELEWIEDGYGGFRVVPHSPRLEEVDAAHARPMAHYDATFRRLARE